MAGEDFPGDNTLSFFLGPPKKNHVPTATGRPDAWQVCFTYYGQLISPPRIKNTSYAVKCCRPSGPQTLGFEAIQTSECTADIRGNYRLLSYDSGFPKSSPGASLTKCLCQQTVPSVILTVSGSWRDRRGRAMGRAGRGTQATTPLNL